MKTVYLLAHVSRGTLVRELQPPGTKVFCVGVEGGHECSLELLQKNYPEIVVERLPEGVNLNYLQQPDERRVLQPAFLSLKG